MIHLEQNMVFAGRYLLIKQIGIGGFSEVWLAKDQMTSNTEIALKVFVPEKGLDDVGISQFSDEYAITQPLNHSNLVKVNYFDIEKGSPFLVMPFMRQGSLTKQLFEKKSLSEKDIAQIILDIAGALDYLHHHKIVHQDIKPDNILMDDGKYMLSDFGISGKMRSTLRKHSTTKNAITVAYASPERFGKRPMVHPAGDVFSLAVMIYELATGEVPWMGAGGIVLHNNNQIPLLPTSYSPEFINIIEQCMAIKPEERPLPKDLLKSAKSFVQTGKWTPIAIEVKPDKAEQIGRKTTIHPPKDIVPSQAKENAKPKPKKKKKGVIAVVLSIVVVAIIAGVYFVNEASKQREFDSLYNNGLALFSEGNFFDAKNTFIDAQGIKSNYSIEDKIEACNDSIDQGYKRNVNAANKMFQQNDFLKAVVLYKNALKYKPGDEFVLNKLSSLNAKIDNLFNATISEGKRLLAEKQFESATQQFEKANEIKPNNNETPALFAQVDRDIENAYTACINEGNDFLDRKKFNEAKNSFNQALLYKPNDETAKNSLSKIPERYYYKPSITKGNKGKYASLELVSIEITKTETLISFKFKKVNDDGYNVSLYGPNSSNAFYLKDYSGNKYKLKRAQGISFGENQRISGTKNFKLVFERLPSQTRKIDIIQGINQIVESVTYWNFKGILLN